MQDDILFQTFTCEECLEFTAKLRLGLPKHQVKERVDLLINQLGLQHCRKTLVGSPLIRGLSGGEKKRTSIAVELVTNPSVIFFDEPTSGLDSFNAEKIVKLLVSQAKLGKTIISTIHQPNSECFASFDRILLLMEGHTIYQGSAYDSVEYFQKLGYKCPEYSNPADYFLKEFSTPRKLDSSYVEKVNTISKAYESHLMHIIEQEDSISDHPQISKSLLKSRFREVSWCREFELVVKRTFMDMHRNPMYMGARICQTIMTGLLALALFWNLDYGPAGVENKIRMLYFICIDQTMMTMFSVLMVFLNERDVFIREYANHTYG